MPAAVVPLLSCTPSSLVHHRLLDLNPGGVSLSPNRFVHLSVKESLPPTEAEALYFEYTARMVFVE